jgi:GDPmannose 4,6-dehydratase
MWLMLQAKEPNDYVIAMGEAHSVREFLELAAARAGVDLTDRVAIDPRYHRPTEVDCLLGDPTQARRELGWQPRVSFEQLVHMMVDADLELAARERDARTRSSKPHL